MANGTDTAAAGMGGLMRRTKALLKIREGEGGKVILFALLAALLQGGLTIGMSAVDAIFLTEAGAGMLPFIYLLTPVLMFAYVPVFSYLMARFGVNRVFELTLGVLTAGGILLYLLFSGYIGPIEGHARVAMLFAVKLYANMWLFALYTLYWNFTDAYFDILDAKRLFAFFSAGAAFGAMAGGGAVTLLIRYIDTRQLFLAWAACALLTFPLLWFLRRRCPPIEVDETLDETAPAFAEQARQMAHSLRRSRYVMLFFLTMFLTLTITVICEYQYMSCFAATARAAAEAELGGTPDPALIENLSSQKLASLFGKLGAAANAFNLLVNLFLFNRLVAFLGVRNVALVQPLIYVGTFTFMLLSYGFPSAIAGFFAYQGIMISIEQNNQNFLFNALPSAVRRQLRTFMEGIAEPLAVAIAGMFLILYGRDVGEGSIDPILQKLFGESGAATFKSAIGVGLLTDVGISTIGLIGAVVVVLVAWMMRGDYVRAMVVNLRRGWLDFSTPDREALGGLEATELDGLRKTIATADLSCALRATRILLRNHPLDAFIAWQPLWHRLEAGPRECAQSVLVDMLRTGDPELALAIVDWLQNEQVEPIPEVAAELGSHGRIAPSRATGWLSARTGQRRAAGAVALLGSWRFDQAAPSIETILQMLKDSETDRVIALQSLGHAGQERHAHYVAGFLNDPAIPVQLAALQALEQLATPASTRLVPRLITHLDGADGAARARLLNILERIGDSDLILPLLRAALTFSPAEKRRAEQVVSSIGLKGVPAATSALQDPSVPHRGRVIAARALARVAFPQFESLAPRVIDMEIARAYRFIALEATLAPVTPKTPGLAFLERFHADIQVALLDFILELLTLQGRLPNFELLAASLRSSNPKERGNAIETIEQGCSRPLFRALLPLIDSRVAEERAAAVRAFCTDVPATPAALIEEALNSPIALEAAAALQAAVEHLPRETAQAALTRTLAGQPEPLVRRTALQLVDRLAGATAPTGIEQLVRIYQAPFFRTFSTVDTAAFLCDSDCIDYPAGAEIYRTGDEADALFILVDGETDSPGSTPGAVLGIEAVRHAARRTTPLRSRGVRLLHIAAPALRNAALASPRAAIGLMEQAATL